MKKIKALQVNWTKEEPLNLDNRYLYNGIKPFIKNKQSIYDAYFIKEVAYELRKEFDKMTVCDKYELLRKFKEKRFRRMFHL